MPNSSNVPATFWKYLLVVLRFVFDLDFKRCKKTMEDFHVSKKVAEKWTAALSVSCMFNVKYGKRHDYNKPGTPTIITYRPESTDDDWHCFTRALDTTAAKFRGKDKVSAAAFRRTLVENLIEERRGEGLPVEELEYVQELPDTPSDDLLVESLETESGDYLQ